jgi:hypothetical protein
MIWAPVHLVCQLFGAGIRDVFNFLLVNQDFRAGQARLE